PDGIGFYDASAIETAWHTAHNTGAPPPITAVNRLVDQNHQLVMVPERQNSLTRGYSMLFCYAPLFGYHLERFPFETIHPGGALMAFKGRLNFKNPACYVFPGANQCAPGDQFGATDADQLREFLAYGPLPF